MDEKLREQIVVAIEKAMKAVGAEGYESGIEQTRKLAAFVHQGAESMKTLDDLRVLLDRLPPLSKREELIHFHDFPEFARYLTIRIQTRRKEGGS